MKISYSCKQIAMLLSQALDEPLGVMDQLKLKFHLSICGDCRNVEQQMAKMNDLMHDSFSFDESLAVNPGPHQNSKQAASDA
jgi:predicted anti-sigma-YlaC factor YlaD